MIKEVWKTVQGYNQFEASNLGNIRTKNRVVQRKNGRPLTVKGKTLTKHINRWGYEMVKYSSDGKSRLYLVHRLVYLAFYGEIPSGFVVDHINNKRSDNRIDNLQAITNAENLSKDRWRSRKHNLPTGVNKNIDGGYVAEFYAGNKRYYLGVYSTADSAGEAYRKAKDDYYNKGIIPDDKRLRHRFIGGYKVCPCCGEKLPITEYYVSRGRAQGACKSCFKKARKIAYQTRKQSF